MIFEDIVEASAYARPGYALAAFKEVGLPIYQLTTRVVTLERKQLSPLEEACLKAVSAGLRSPSDICDFLGLPMQVVKGTLASLNSREQINYVRPVGADHARVLLTSRGKIALEHAEIIQPEERLVKICFDPLRKRVVFLPSVALFPPKNVRDRGWFEVPLCGAKRPELEDISLTDIDKALQKTGRGKDNIRELLSIRRIERRELLFVPCIALFYRAHDRSEVQVAFHLDDGFSIEHETAFAVAGGPEIIGAMHVLKPQVFPSIDTIASHIEAAKATTAELEALERTMAAASNIRRQDNGPSTGEITATVSGEVELVQEAAKKAEEQLKRLTQRLLRCHEHPKLLRDVLAKTQKRLLIISPWIRHQVVDSSFINCLEALLRNGVEIYIGYGLANEGRAGDREKESITPQARADLDKLKKRFNNFTCTFVGNTHRKMLIYDNRFAVITSFNWLSFKGNPKDRARDEAGYLVSEASAVEEIFRDCLRLIEEGYDHPKLG